MGAVENTLIILLVVLASGLIVPELFLRLKMPYVTTLILIGALLGPHGIGYVGSNEMIEFFGIVSTPQLTTTLAVTYAAARAGLLESSVTTAIIAISVITTVLAPAFLKFHSERFGVRIMPHRAIPKFAKSIDS